MSQNVPEVGKLIVGVAHRDAIHVAIAPVIAKYDLWPSDDVGYAEDGLMVSYEGKDENKNIGIVDPFLKEKVRAGQRFYLFLYPGTITSLRHLWTHKAFDRKSSEATE